MDEHGDLTLISLDLRLFNQQNNDKMVIEPRKIAI